MNNQEINVVKFDENISKSDYESIKALYNEAFPEKERIIGTFDDFINQVNTDKRFELNLIYAVPLDDGTNQLVAFSYNLVEEDYFYGIFVAIKKEYRTKGYGKKIINYFKGNQAKNKHFFLCAEKVEDTAENKQQRINRQAFFHKLGFSVVESDIVINGVSFDFYSLNKVTHDEVDRYIYRIQNAIMPDYYEKN